MRFLIWVVLLLWSMALLRRVIGWTVRSLFGTAPEARPAGPGPESQHTGRLVRDPVCGLYIPEERAITLRGGQQELHFCSTPCRDQYLKCAANG